ncbi:MAG: MFS transporter [Ignavibacteriales bacterium]|nr:MFS transporter [Ignavibacteriales bacterium]
MSFVGSLLSRSVGGAMFRSLRHRNYRLFFAGQLFSLTGTWIQMVAQSWLVYDLTHSAIWLGIVGFLGSIPTLFFAMPGGAVADRFEKKKVLVVTQSVAAIQALGLAALIGMDLVTPLMVGLFALLLGIVNAFDAPSRLSFVGEMVGKEDLANGVALNSALFNSARMIGPAIGGVLIAAYGVGWCFFLNGISFLAVIAGLIRMDIPEQMPKSASHHSMTAAIREALSYIRHHATFAAIMVLVATVTVFGWSYSVLLPIIADKILKSGAIGLGNLLTATGFGALCGALTVAAKGSQIHPRRVIYGGLSIFVVSVFAFTFTATPLMAMLCLVGVGFGLVSFFSTANATLQRNAPDHLRGRIMGLYTLVFTGFFPFGSLAIGFLADHIGAQQAIMLGASVCAIAGLLVYSAMKKNRLAAAVKISQKGIV